MSKYEKGVKQGDGLSTLLFNVYTNDINKIFDASISDPVGLNSTRLNCLVYVDDLLLSESKKVYYNPVLILCKCTVIAGSLK